MKLAWVFWCLVVGLGAEPPAPTPKSDPNPELSQTWSKVLQALPDALKIGEKVSAETLSNVRKALEQSVKTKTNPQTSQEQVAETEQLLLHIEKLSRQLSHDVLGDVNKTVKELNALSESIE